MHINSEDTVVGQPAIAIRDVLPQAQLAGGVAAMIEHVLHTDPETARRIMADLEEQGYIECRTTSNATDGEDVMWDNTVQGNALANASARQPIKRGTAERLLAEFLERVQQVNASDDFVFRVEQVVVFGSYVKDTPTLSDLDLSLILAPRYDDLGEMLRRRQERIRRAIERGKLFGSVFEQLTWPTQEVLRFLKGRSPSISLHDEHDEQVLSKGLEARVVFPDGES